jgi:hypothetical protein
VKHLDLIKAVLGSKEGAVPVLEYRSVNTDWKLVNFESTPPSTVINWLTTPHGQAMEVRKKPEPIPDQVFYDSVRKSTRITLDNLKTMWRGALDEVDFVKITIKTDSNGKQTKHVEIVE